MLKPCSELSQLLEEDPIGTAPIWTKCIVIELPPPWSAKIEKYVCSPTIAVSHSFRFCGAILQKLASVVLNNQDSWLMTVLQFYPLILNV